VADSYAGANGFRLVSMIVVIDYGMGNLGTVAAKIKKNDPTVIVSSRETDIENADKLVLPGVGSFKAAMDNLESRGLIPVLCRQVIKNKVPILGICLGMQLFSRQSEEGDSKGLGWIDADTVRFRFSEKQNPLPIPHMGWNTVHFTRELPLMKGIENDKRFYFTHSYHISIQNADDAGAFTEYGYEFCSIINHQNITGVQFHPERSHKNGLALLSNFVRGE
jgi:glutamine amidotransferase